MHLLHKIMRQYVWILISYCTLYTSFIVPGLKQMMCKLCKQQGINILVGHTVVLKMCIYIIYIYIYLQDTVDCIDHI